MAEDQKIKQNEGIFTLFAGRKRRHYVVRRSPFGMQGLRSSSDLAVTHRSQMIERLQHYSIIVVDRESQISREHRSYLALSSAHMKVKIKFGNILYLTVLIYSMHKRNRKMHFRIDLIFFIHRVNTC